MGSRERVGLVEEGFVVEVLLVQDSHRCVEGLKKSKYKKEEERGK